MAILPIPFGTQGWQETLNRFLKTQDSRITTTEGDLTTHTHDDRYYTESETDAQLAAIGTWQAYTPTLGGFTGTVDHARYTQIGTTVMVRAKITLTSLVTATMTVSLPVEGETTAQVGRVPVGDVQGWDIGTGSAFGNVIFNSSTAVHFTSTASWSSTFPFVWAVNDVIAFTATYEAL